MLLATLPKHTKLKLTEPQREKDESAIPAGDDNIVLVMDRFSSEKISEDRNELNTTINQQNLIDICGIIHSTTAECTIFQFYTLTFTKIDHILEL